jgi:4-oxalocrotonate tautomerase
MENKMPILNVKVSAKKSPELVTKIVDHLTDITSRILKKKREVTAITIDFVEPDAWSVGGQLLSDLGRSSFYFDIKITDETNTKDEKAQYIQEAFEGFARILGKLNEESYVHIEDVRAASYGFGGKTQEYRYHH